MHSPHTVMKSATLNTFYLLRVLTSFLLAQVQELKLKLQFRLPKRFVRLANVIKLKKFMGSRVIEILYDKCCDLE